MEFLSEVLTELDMTRKEDVSQNLKPNRIMKNTRDLEKILRSIQENMNPFNEASNKLMAVEMVRDLFESILFLNLQRKIDIAAVFVISTYIYTTIA